MALQWYFRTAGADANNPASYTLVGGSPPSCVGTTKICSIYANDDGFGSPDIDSTIQGQMVTALNTGTNQTQVLLRSAN